MWISSEKYHDDISVAYTKGLEQGFELSRKLKQIRERNKQEPSPQLDLYQAEETSLLLQQLVDIAERKGIKLK
ncbi:MAG: hypothetical protein JSV77_02455 [Dehalococcoidales bacterium]|nr:MAG: hypothetical protein JSV77_02455 [Dehalococcoidales bacterium]